MRHWGLIEVGVPISSCCKIDLVVQSHSLLLLLGALPWLRQQRDVRARLARP